MTNRRTTDAKISYLDFEQGIAELEKRIEALQVSHDDHDQLDISKELDQLEKKNKKMLEDTYNNLTAWQISQVARHPQRPYTLDYIRELFTDFEELHGDRAYADDPAIVGGLAVRCPTPGWRAPRPGSFSSPG